MSTRLTSILFADDTSCFIEGTDLSDMCIQLSTEMNKLSTLPGLTLSPLHYESKQPVLSSQ